MPTSNARPASRTTAARAGELRPEAAATIPYDALMEELFAQIDRTLDASERLTAGLMNQHA